MIKNQLRDEKAVFGTLIAHLGQMAKFVHDNSETNMSKINSVVDFIDAGIKAEQLRQKAIANNLANLQTPGYRAIDVKFEELLSRAFSADGNVDTDEISPDIYQPAVTTLKSDGNDVSLEAEVGKMVKNSLKHTTYVRLLKKLYDQMDLAINVK